MAHVSKSAGFLIFQPLWLPFESHQQGQKGKQNMALDIVDHFFAKIETDAKKTGTGPKIDF